MLLAEPEGGSNSALHPSFRNDDELLDRRHLTQGPDHAHRTSRVPRGLGKDRSFSASTGRATGPTGARMLPFRADLSSTHAQSRPSEIFSQ